MLIPFRKMDGAGNDFVIFDVRGHVDAVPAIVANVAAIASRANTATGGCDQVIVMEDSAKADVRMRIFNPDSEEVGACGNATRCVGWLAMQEKTSTQARVEVSDRVLECEEAGVLQVRVDMGRPSFEPRALHLSDETVDVLHLPIVQDGYTDPAGVSMGNPHMVFFVADVAAVKLAEIGPKLETHPLYTQKANVSFVQVISETELKAAVWERGAGITQACGTAACAIGVAAARRGLSGRDVKIHMPGGTLRVEWDQNDHVFLSGPVRDQGEGELAVESTLAGFKLF